MRLSISGDPDSTPMITSTNPARAIFSISRLSILGWTMMLPVRAKSRPLLMMASQSASMNRMDPLVDWS